MPFISLVDFLDIGETENKLTNSLHSSSYFSSGNRRILGNRSEGDLCWGDPSELSYFLTQSQVSTAVHR